MTLARVEAPHFVCGIILDGERVVRTAPITKYMRGWNWMKVAVYCRKKRWTVTILS